MFTIDEIIAYIEEISGADYVKKDSDIFDNIGIVGDDWHEFIEKYSKKFRVDISNYLWYFHTHEEGNNSFGGDFFKAPNERVKRIPVTPQMLLNFANSGKWNIVYPEHYIPKRRWDLIINQILLIALILIPILIYLLKKYF